MRLVHLARSAWSFISNRFGVRHFQALRESAAERSEYEESVTVDLGAGYSVAAHSKGSSLRRRQRNSKKRVASLRETMDIAELVYRRAWKFARYDSGLSEWPATNVDFLASGSFKNEDVLIDLSKWKVAARSGFDISMMLPAREDNGWKPDTYLLTRMRTFKQESSSPLMREFLKRFDVFVELGGVVVEIGGRRPYTVHGSFGLDKSGAVARFDTRGQVGNRVFVEIAKRDERSERELRQIAQVYAAYHFGRSFLWDLCMTKGSSRFRIAVDRVGARELAHMRDPNGERRRALLHWVNGSKGAYLRGETDFSWSGFQCSVVPSNHDAQRLADGELPIGSLVEYLENAEVAA